MIKLTGFSNGEPLWINPDKVTLIEKREGFGGIATCIDFEKGMDAAVQESPEEVVKLIVTYSLIKKQYVAAYSQLISDPRVEFYNAETYLMP